MANYNVTINSTVASKGSTDSVTLIMPNGSSTGPGYSASSPLSVNPGDTITFVPGNMTQTVNFSPPDFIFTNSADFSIISGGSSVVRTVDTIAGIIEIRAVGTQGFPVPVDSFFPNVQSDSVPNAFPISNITNATPDAYYTRTITISGLGTSNETLLFCIGADAQVKVNSGAYVDVGEYVRASNGDVVTLKLRAPPYYNMGSIVTLVARDLNTVSSDTYSTITLPGVYTTDVPGTSTYGFECFNSSGVKTIAITSRSPRYVSQGAGTLTLNNSSGTSPALLTASATITITGMENNDNWLILLSHGWNYSITEEAWTVTKSTGQFTITLQGTVAAGSSTTSAYSYKVLRGG